MKIFYALIQQDVVIGSNLLWGGLRRDVGMKLTVDSHTPSMRTWHQQFLASMTEDSIARPTQVSQFL